MSSLARVLSSAVFHFFQAGGTDALIVRVTPVQDAPHTQPTTSSLNSAGDDDGPISGMDIGLGATLATARKGLWALEKAEHFNLMCIPPYSFDDDDDVDAATWQVARTYCRSRRAMLIMDPPSHWNIQSDAVSGVDDLRGTYDDHAALYFPRIRMPDPLEGGRMVTFAPGGMIAGIYARTDSQ